MPASPPHSSREPKNSRAKPDAGLLELSTHTSNRTAQRVYSGAGWSRDDDYYHYHRKIERS